MFARAVTNDCQDENLEKRSEPMFAIIVTSVLSVLTFDSLSVSGSVRLKGSRTLCLNEDGPLAKYCLQLCELPGI